MILVLSGILWIVLLSDRRTTNQHKTELERRAKRPIDLCIRMTSVWVRSIGRFARRSNSVAPTSKLGALS